MKSGIYWIYQPSRDRVIYVGSSTMLERRIRDHKSALRRGKHRNAHLQNIWNKYGQADVVISVLEECSINGLVERENFWMNAMPIWPSCNVGLAAYNGMTGRKHLPEARRKMSERGKGRKRPPFTDEHRRNISLARTGKKMPPRDAEYRRKLGATWIGRRHTDETKKKISVSRIGKIPWSKGKKFSIEYKKKMSDSQLGKTPWNKGVKMGVEFGNKMRQAHIGKLLSSDHKRHISEANIGRVVSDETKAKISVALKRREPSVKPIKDITCSDCGAIFPGKKQSKRVLCQTCKKAARKMALKGGG